jgi:hypothetical protein
MPTLVPSTDDATPALACADRVDRHCSGADLIEAVREAARRADYERLTDCVRELAARRRGRALQRALRVAGLRVAGGH